MFGHPDSSHTTRPEQLKEAVGTDHHSLHADLLRSSKYVARSNIGLPELNLNGMIETKSQMAVVLCIGLLEGMWESFQPRPVMGRRINNRASPSARFEGSAGGLSYENCLL
jgi:hypothetical protein